MKIHPSDLLLEEALSVLPGEKGPLHSHLANCPYCRSRLGGLQNHLPWHPDLPDSCATLPGTGALRSSAPITCRSRDSFDYGPAIERSERKYLEHARALHQERAEAPGLLTDLLSHGQEKRQLLLTNSSRFQTWGVCELLLERSWQSRGVSRAQSEALVDLAIHVGPYLDASYYQKELIEDMQARAWSYKANLRRLASDFQGAEEGFQLAYDHLKNGTREPLERAVYLDLKASLRGTQRRMDEAKKLLHRAIAIFLHQGDGHRAGKSMVSLSWIHSNAGELEHAVATLRRSLLMIDPTQDERLLLCAWHNLIDILTSMDRFIEAQGFYRKARPLYRKYANDVEYAPRRLWVKGKIARGLGQPLEAEELFLSARKRFLADGIPYDAALVSLEVAILYAQQNRTAELKPLAAEMLSVFTSRQIEREALAALMFLKQAVDAERLTVQTAAGVVKFFYRAAGNPDLKFEAPA